MGLLDLDVLRHAPVTTDPFTFTVVQDFVPPEPAEAIRRDFPDIPYPGLPPVEATQYGPRFADLIQKLQSGAVAAVFSETFGLDLVGRSAMITVRGRCQERDGRIHATRDRPECPTRARSPRLSSPAWIAAKRKHTRIATGCSTASCRKMLENKGLEPVP